MDLRREMARKTDDVGSDEKRDERNAAEEEDEERGKR